MLAREREVRSIVGQFLIVVCMLLVCVSARAQDGQAPAELSGTVTDAHGSAVPHAKVSAANEGTGLERNVNADAKGGFLIPLLPPGVYTVTVDGDGFPRFQVAGIELRPGMNLRLPIQLPPLTSIRGKVIDLKSGEPIAKALVAIRSQHLQTVTSATGEFQIDDVLPGRADLYVSAVGLELLRKKLDLKAGITNEVQLLLGQDALRRTESVRVNAGPFSQVHTEAPVEQSLTNTELKNLASVLFDDPMRSVESLPGVAANNDLYSEFAVRGAGPSEIGVFVDGALLTNPFHDILDDRGNAYSIGLLQSGFLDSVALLSSNVPAQYGDFTGSVLDVDTREGDSSRTSYRADVSMVAATMSAEGPIGAGRKATWLASARKDYVGVFVGKNNGLGLRFYDTHGTLAYAPNARNKILLSGIYGETSVSKDDSNVLGIDQLKDATSSSALASARWIWSNRIALSEAQFYASIDSANDEDIGNELLERSNGLETGYREDFTVQLGKHDVFEAGGIYRLVRRDYLKNEPWNYATETFSSSLIRSASFSSNVSQPGAYLQNILSTADKRINVIVGGRCDNFSVNNPSVFLPRLSLSIAPLTQTRLTLAAGQYSQFPDLVDLFGEFGTPALRPQRSNQASVAIEQFLSERLRVRLEAYDREERDGIYSVASQFRLAAPGGAILFPQLGPVLANSLRGYSRGLEFIVQRRSDNGLTGWIAYTLGYSRFTDATTAARFWGDYDQRHTLNVFASYRAGTSLNFSANARYGSGFPITGYVRAPFQYEGNWYFPLTATPNQIRMPAYFRLDTRINKAFYRKHSKFTLYAEITNLTDHSNMQYWGFVPDMVQDGYLEAGRGNLLPIIPSVGISAEF
ncbi:MAG: carboxypeptidase regulatory-like domain-containing protein [Terracidiphilus sp.]